MSQINEPIPNWPNLAQLGAELGTKPRKSQKRLIPDDLLVVPKRFKTWVALLAISVGLGRGSAGCCWGSQGCGKVASVVGWFAEANQIFVYPGLALCSCRYPSG